LELQDATDRLKARKGGREGGREGKKEKDKKAPVSKT